jgi:hypothetical protein
LFLARFKFPVFYLKRVCKLFIFHSPPFEITLLWCKKFQNLFRITLQIYSAILTGAMDTVLSFQSSLYILYRNFKAQNTYFSVFVS